MPRRLKRRSETIRCIGRNGADIARPSRHALGYDAAWDKLATLRRNEDFGLCQMCLADDFLTVASDVDHIIPIHVRPDWRLVLGNTQVLCRLHHCCKTRDDGRRYGSSTAVSLTPEQRQARCDAEKLSTPPRDPGGYPFSGDVSAAERMPPCAHFPAKLGGGGIS